MTELTPRQIVAELDKYIVGQAEAKNPWRWPSGTAGGPPGSTNP